MFRTEKPNTVLGVQKKEGRREKLESNLQTHIHFHTNAHTHKLILPLPKHYFARIREREEIFFCECEMFLMVRDGVVFNSKDLPRVSILDF